MSARPFADLLREHRSGLTHGQASDALQQLVTAVVQEQKAGKLVMTIEIKPLAKGDGVEVNWAIDVKPPKEKPGMSIFFPTPEGNLERHDPRQQNMELHEIGPAAAHKGVA